MSGSYKQKKKRTPTYKIGKGGKKVKINLKKRSKLKLTAEMAETILAMPALDGDRHLINAHVDDLVGAMERGTFLPEDVHIDFAHVGKDVYRVNGQHTCWAITLLDGKYEPVVDLFEYECRSIDEALIIYASKDRGKQRLRHHLNKMYLSGFSEFDDVRPEVMKILPGGFALWRFPSKGTTPDADTICAMMRSENLQDVLRLANFLTPIYTYSQCRHIRRRAVISAMFSTFKKAVGDSQVFWAPVVNGVGVESTNDPRGRLRNALTELRINSGAKGYNTSWMAMLKACSHAWNAFREDRSMKILRIVDDGKPVIFR